MKLSLSGGSSFQSLRRRLVRRKARFCRSKGRLMNGQLIHENHRHVVTLGACVLRYAAVSHLKSSRPPAIVHCIIQGVPLCISSLSLYFSLPLSDNDLFSRAAHVNRRQTLAATKPAAVYSSGKGARLSLRLLMMLRDIFTRSKLREELRGPTQ